jgi:hypothetical protein
MRVIQITKEFAEANTNYKVGACTFGYAVTKDGRYVCSVNSELEFPELFKGTDFDIIRVNSNDFETKLNEPAPIDPNKDKAMHIIQLAEGVTCGIVRVPEWDDEKMIIDCNIYFGDDLTQTKRIRLSVDNDVELQGVGAYDLFKSQLAANTPLYPLAEQMLLMRKDYIMNEKL